MRQLVRMLGIVGLAGIVAACSTTGQSSSGGIGETASDTIRDHPQTAAGAGVGAAGGAVVGGLAGGTKGAVVGGLLGALAGGAIGNYIERREASLPQTSPTSPTTTTPSTSGSTVGVPSTTTSPTSTTSASLVRIDRVQTQPSQLRPGDTVNLDATYTILSSSEQMVPVRETREVRLDGELVANPAVDVTRQTGTYSSALPITLPANARAGKYEVTTTVASGDRRSTSTTSFSVQ
jgi:Glycine zipper